MSWYVQVEVKVTTKVSVENVEIGVADKDQTSAARTTKWVSSSSSSSLLSPFLVFFFIFCLVSLFLHRVLIVPPLSVSLFSVSLSLSFSPSCAWCFLFVFCLVQISEFGIVQVTNKFCANSVDNREYWTVLMYLSSVYLLWGINSSAPFSLVLGVLSVHAEIECAFSCPSGWFTPTRPRTCWRLTITRRSSCASSWRTAWLGSSWLLIRSVTVPCWTASDLTAVVLRETTRHFTDAATTTGCLLCLVYYGKYEVFEW